jgi:hypothetical protein
LLSQLSNPSQRWWTPSPSPRPTQPSSSHDPSEVEERADDAAAHDGDEEGSQREVTNARVAEEKTTTEREKEAEHIQALKSKANANAFATQVVCQGRYHYQ